MKKVLVSACLLGQPVRYDAKDKRSAHPILTRWVSEGRVVAVCPEVAGGLPVPRPPAEQQPDGRVVDIDGRDVTAQFDAGAAHAVALARQHGITIAVLKEGSPSCGSSVVGDGTHTKTKVPGQGVAAAALRAIGVRVFSEAEIDRADTALFGCFP